MGRASRKGSTANSLREPVSDPQGALAFRDVYTGQEICVIPGQLNETAENVYNNGQCAYLALALRERTGGQIWAMVDPAYDDEGVEMEPPEITDSRGQFLEEHIPGHFGVEVDGEIVDINGSESLELWEDHHGGYAVPVTDREIAEWQIYHQRKNQYPGPPPSEEQLLELARSFVDPILEKSSRE